MLIQGYCNRTLKFTLKLRGGFYGSFKITLEHRCRFILLIYNFVYCCNGDLCLLFSKEKSINSLFITVALQGSCDDFL